MIYDIKIIAGSAAAPIVNPFYAAHGSQSQARDDDTFFMAYEPAGDLVGVVRFCVENDVSMLRSMRVHTDFRGKQAGSALLAAFREFLDQNGVRDTYCLPFSHLETFYGRIGFKTVPEGFAPPFLEDRMRAYRAQQMNVICMKRG